MVRKTNPKFMLKVCSIIAQRFNALCSIPAVPNSAVIWVLVMMAPMPKISIDMMSQYGTVPRVPITTGRMAVST